MATGTILAGLVFAAVATMRQLRPVLDADTDRAGLELRLTLKDRARVHPRAGNGGRWREAAVRTQTASP
jgi:hypothetical protein